jgi:hypothetical protein
MQLNKIKLYNPSKPKGIDTYTRNEVDNKFIAFGTNLIWKGAVATYADLATTYPNPEDNWTVPVNDEMVDYRYDAETLSWINIGNSAIPLATESVDGKMSSTDKTKLNGIAPNANNYAHPSGDGNLHVPATGTTNNTKVLKAGATAASAAWGQVAANEVSDLANSATITASITNTADTIVRRTSDGSIEAQNASLGGSLSAPYGNVTAGGSVTATGTVKSGKDLYVGKVSNAWITAEPLGSGTDGVDQAGGLSIGESGKKGAAAVHLVYIGTGYSYLGMGTVDATSGLPAYWVMRMHYQSPDAYFNRHVTAGGDITGLSDAKLKDDVISIENALELVMQLDGKRYTRNDQNGKKELGFIAQEVKKVVPEFVRYDEQTDLHSMDYGKMNALLVNAIKEQQGQIDALKGEIQQLKTKN